MQIGMFKMHPIYIYVKSSFPNAISVIPPKKGFCNADAKFVDCVSDKTS